MKNNVLKTDAATTHQMRAGPTCRYEIFRQARAGTFTPEFRTNSPAEAVEMFATMAPAFDGGSIRMWDHRQQRLCATVHWKLEKTDFGFVIHHRTNLYYDWLLCVIARRVQERRAVRPDAQQSIEMSA